MEHFSHIGEIMKEKFDGASEVMLTRKGEETRMMMKHGNLKRHTHADLV